MFVSVRMQFHNHVDQGLKHAGRMAPEGILCSAGPRCVLGIFMLSAIKFFSLFIDV